MTNTYQELINKEFYEELENDLQYPFKNTKEEPIKKVTENLILLEEKDFLNIKRLIIDNKIEVFEWKENEVLIKNFYNDDIFKKNYWIEDLPDLLRIRLKYKVKI